MGEYRGKQERERAPMKLTIPIICLILTSGWNLNAQIGSRYLNSKVYVEEMENDFDGYLRAELIKKKIPFVIVTSLEDADLVIIGSATDEEKRKWHEGWLTSVKEHTSGNISLVERDGGSVIWAAQAGDRPSWGFSRPRAGHLRLATRIVKKLRQAIHESQSLMNAVKQHERVHGCRVNMETVRGSSLKNFQCTIITASK